MCHVTFASPTIVTWYICFNITLKHASFAIHIYNTEQCGTLHEHMTLKTWALIQFMCMLFSFFIIYNIVWFRNVNFWDSEHPMKLVLHIILVFLHSCLSFTNTESFSHFCMCLCYTYRNFNSIHSSFIVSQLFSSLAFHLSYVHSLIMVKWKW